MKDMNKEDLVDYLLIAVGVVAKCGLLLLWVWFAIQRLVIES